MSNLNGLIYIDTSTDPDIGVSIADIQETIRSGKRDLGGLITSGKINPWALYKPAPALSKSMITRGLNMDSLAIGNAARTVPGPPYASSVNGLVALYTDGETNSFGASRANGWRYWAPRGASYNEWFRFFDFVKVVSENGTLHPVANSGYNHKSRNPFGRFWCSDSVSRYGGLFQAGNDTPYLPLSDDNIAIEDINSIWSATSYKLSYYGVLLVPENTSHACHVIFNKDNTIYEDNTGDNYIRGNENMRLDDYYVYTNDLAADNYTAYPFIANIALDSNTRNLSVSDKSATIKSGARLYPIPGVTPTVIIVYDSLIVIRVHASTATGNTPPYDTSIYIEITNNGSTDYTITNLVLKWRLTSSSWGESRKTGEVFYDGQYRTDDDYPSGHADSSYSALLASRNIPATSTVRVPVDSSLTIMGSVPSRDATQLFIGVSNSQNIYGSTNVRIPASPTLEVE